MDEKSKEALDKATALIDEADEVIIERLTELRKENRQAEMQELVDAHAQRASFQDWLDEVRALTTPTYKELQDAHAAESRKISKLIEEGYDFKEEMGKSPIMKVFGSPPDREKRKSNDDQDPPL
ncbi:hypothetical protein LPB19_12480 [Marinobacter salinisoli]|uniref:Uncharacterized protein n=1 Tax=Marinobacter salinisoli TaxID=2769486 RepID=A0ABX7MNY3_9GAMM|nr:hypothetical protein [Marinobacter salinisoli]QSP94005.1 hypothetical protein LPB19_12480 [Marinobacter salinisoli]